jgi:hypothetical protein
MKWLFYSGVVFCWSCGSTISTQPTDIIDPSPVFYETEMLDLPDASSQTKTIDASVSAAQSVIDEIDVEVEE